MDIYPKTAEELATDYDLYIRDWIKFENFANLDSDDFVGSFYEKVLTKNILDKFDPEQGFLFETWLSKVLKNHYLDKYNASLKDNWVSITIDEENDDSQTIRGDMIPIEEDGHLDSFITKDYLDKLINAINNIEDDRDRVLIKLKFYQKGQTQLINFKNNDISYILSVSDLDESQIMKFIDDNAKQAYGLKDKDICTLINMASGSINTIFQRAVRKWLKA
tara:strand:+ start:54 stop:713 length:660 start_codon:yes stop_codon:yes gene_type:complete